MNVLPWLQALGSGGHNVPSDISNGNLYKQAGNSVTVNRYQANITRKQISKRMALEDSRIYGILPLKGSRQDTQYKRL